MDEDQILYFRSSPSDVPDICFLSYICLLMYCYSKKFLQKIQTHMVRHRFKKYLICFCFALCCQAHMFKITQSCSLNCRKPILPWKWKLDSLCSLLLSWSYVNSNVLDNATTWLVSCSDSPVTNMAIWDHTCNNALFSAVAPKEES